MSIFPEDKHLEVFIKPNKSSPPPDPTPVFVQALVISIPISLAMSLSLIEEIPVSINPDFTYTSSGNGAGRGVTAEPSYTGDSVSPSENVQPPPLQGQSFQGNSTDSFNGADGATVSNMLLSPYTISIPQFCNDTALAGANFQSEPTMAGVATQGIIAAGTEVTLTGATAYGDGIIWFQAVNEIALTPSAHPEAQNQTEPFQIGWIADCFVRGSGYF